MRHDGGAPPEGTSADLAFIAQALPHALQVARRVARTTRVLDREDLEAEARLAVTELAPLFDPTRGLLKTFVSTRVGFRLTAALRKERRCANVSAEDAIQAGLAHVEGMELRVDAAWISDKDAYAQLAEVTAEVADVLALHTGTPDTVADVHEVVAQLPPFEARVIAMHYLEHKTFRQIAEELGCSPSRAYRAHESALPALRRKLTG